jgi:hypothetical protein
MELLHQREDVAMVLGEKLAQVFAAAGSHLILGFRDRAGIGEVLVNLAVKVVAVGDASARAHDLQTVAADAIERGEALAL